MFKAILVLLAALSVSEAKHIRFGTLEENSRGRGLQQEQICETVENLFNEDVVCSCKVDTKTGTSEYSCKSDDSEVCFAGVCFIPTYDGTFLLEDNAVFQGAFKGGTCADETQFLNFPLVGNVELGKICIEADFEVNRDETGTIQADINDCKAEAFGIDCSCEPCTLNDGANGVALNCDGLSVDDCLPLELPLSTFSDIINIGDFFSGIDIEGFVTERIEELTGQQGSGWFAWLGNLFG